MDDALEPRRLDNAFRCIVNFVDHFNQQSEVER